MQTSPTMSLLCGVLTPLDSWPYAWRSAGPTLTATKTRSAALVPVQVGSAQEESPCLPPALLFGNSMPTGAVRCTSPSANQTAATPRYSAIPSPGVGA